MGCLLWLIFPFLRAPCRLLQWSAEFTRRLVKSSLGGRVYAFCEMRGQLAFPKKFFAPLVDLSQAVAGCGGLWGLVHSP